MRFVRFTPVGGASGDMILAALAGLGADLAAIEADLRRLLPEAFHIRSRTVASHGLHGLRVEVDVGGEPHGHGLDEDHGHAHGHDHHSGDDDAARGHAHARDHDHHHDHGHDDRHAHAHHHHEADAPHGHRSFKDIRAMIEASDLPAPVREDSIRVFRRLAEAEGRVHGRPAEEVHFHEVGATDSIVDIVGACLALHRLGVARVAVDLPFPTGHGVVECAHGTYPVPPPAVVELLKGYPVEATDVNRELLTPTGAALLVDAMERGSAPGAGRLLAAAHAFGHRDHGARRPNVLRACLYESDEAPVEAAECLVLETNLDDLSGEGLGILMERLRAAGALDVYGIPLQMKKNRPGTMVGVIARPEDREKLLDVFFREGTTLGVREHLARRMCLPRRHVPVATAYGEVRVKIGTWRGEDVIRAPEMEDCQARAREHNVPARRVYEAAVAAAASLEAK